MLRRTLSALVILTPTLTLAADKDPSSSPTSGLEIPGRWTGWSLSRDGSTLSRLPDVEIGVRREPPSPETPVPMEDFEKQRQRLEREKKGLEEQRKRLEMERELRRKRMEEKQYERENMQKERLFRQPQPNIGIRKEQDHPNPEDLLIDPQ